MSEPKANVSKANTPLQVLARLEEIEARKNQEFDGEAHLTCDELDWLIKELRLSLEAEQGLVEALEKMSDRETSEQTLNNRAEWTSERSFGNADDVFSDGQDNASAWRALDARAALDRHAKIRGERE